VGLGSILAFTMRKTRRVLRHNLIRIGRGRFTEAKISRLILQTFHNYARYLVDFMNMTAWDLEDIPRVIRRFSGQPTFERALTRGQGVILVTPHFGNWELGGAFLSAQGFSVNVVSLVAPDQATVSLREKVRERLGIRHIYVGEGEGPMRMLGILNALRRNEIVAMLCDRDSTNATAIVDLFGHPFVVPTGPALLAQITGAPIIPSFIVRRGGKYDAFIGKPILVANDSTRDRDALIREKTGEMAREFEKIISRFPDQWYNFFPAWAENHGPESE
jgi:KDO2-lipid IV(A) lauroyltransferase